MYHAFNDLDVFSRRGRFGQTIFSRDGGTDGSTDSHTKGNRLVSGAAGVAARQRVFDMALDKQ